MTSCMISIEWSLGSLKEEGIKDVFVLCTDEELRR